MATINGTSGNDILTGTSSNDTIVGGAGNDTISGGAGDDKLNGGAGSDTISGGTGNDTILGGEGNDTLSGDSGNDTILGGEGADTINGGAGSDVIDAGSGNDIVIHASLSTSDIDVYTGGSGFDTLVFELTTPEYTILKNEIDALKAWIANYANSTHWADYPPTQGYDASPWFIFNSIHLAVKDFEAVTVKIINTAPVANNDSLTTSEDTPLNNISSTLLANDTDVDSNPLQIIAVSNAVNGTVTLQNGQVSFIPTADFYGIASFQYQISDGAGGTATASVKINVTEVNDAPIANPDKATVAEDSVSNIINVLNNDTTGPANESAQMLTVTAASALHGSVSINADNTLSYTPDADYNGFDTITYTVTDNGTTNGSQDPKSATSTVTVTVTEVNDAPTANSDKATVAEDSVNNIINVLNNDTTGPANESAQMLTVTAASALHGSVSINADNTLSYTPDGDYNGPDTITYSVIDNGTTNGSPDPKSATSTVNVTVTEVNDAPIANSDSATLAEDSTVFINVLANDRAGPTNENGQTLTVTSASAQNGNVTINPNGILSYTPFANFFGADTISYTITDDGTTNGAPDPKSASSIVNLTVTPVNDLPVANPDTLQTAEDTPLFIPTAQLLANDVDPDGPALTILNVFNAINGTTIFSGGSTTFIPSPDFYGTGSFQYLLSDGAGGTSVGTVTINISEVNDAPIANPDSATLTEDSTAFINVLANDRAGPTNENGQTLTVTSASAQHGNVTINPNGILSYTPFANFSGADTISYSITDNGTTNGAPDPKSASSIVNLTVTPVNDLPVANPDTLQTAEDTPLFIPTAQLLANDVDPDGPVLTILNVFNAINGATIFSGGSTTFIPSPDFYGTGSFQYLLSDGAGGTSTGIVTINISEVNDAPIARPDSATVNQGSTNNIIPVLVNDSAGPANESSQILSVTSAIAANGSVFINPNGTLSYTPSGNFSGVDIISYTISDNGTTNGVADPKSASSVVNITVNPTFGSIAAFVFSDNDANGIFNPLGETSLAGVTINLYRDGNVFGIRDAGDMFVTSLTSDFTDRYVYQFENLAPGSYWLDVDESTLPANYTLTTGTFNQPNEPQLVFVAPAQLQLATDIGYAPGGSIAAFVFSDNDANGIFNPLGETSLAGVTINLYRDGNVFGIRDAGDMFVTSLTSDFTDRYVYQFENLAPGSYWLDVDESTLPANYTLTTGTFNQPNEPQLVFVAPAQLRLATDIGYAPGGSIAAFVFSDNDANGIFNPLGETSLAGVTINLYRDGDVFGIRDAGDMFVTSLTSDFTDRYVYQFENLAPGSYWLDIDESTLPTNYTLTTNNEPQLVFLAPAQSLLAADIGYAPGGSISNFIFADNNASGGWNPLEPGLIGVAMNLYKDGNVFGVRDGGDIFVTLQVSNSTGHYLFENLAPGPYWLDIDESTLPTNYTLTTNNEPQLVFVAPAQTLLAADIGYAPGGSISDFIFADNNASGGWNPLEPGLIGVTMNLYKDGNVFGVRDGGDIFVTLQVSNSTGHYLFENLAPGPYWLDIDESTLPTNYTLTTNNEPQLVFLAPAQALLAADIGYAPGGSIAAFVFSDNDANGIFNPLGETSLAGVTINLYRDGNVFGIRDAGDMFVTSLTSDFTDRYVYQFENLAPGSYWLDVDESTLPTNYTLTTNNEPQLVFLAPAQSLLAADIGYAPGGSISNFIFADNNASGGWNPLEPGLIGVAMNLYKDGNVFGVRDGGDIFVTLQVSNSTGHYLFENLAPGPYWLDIDESTLPTNYTLTTNNEPQLVFLAPAQSLLAADIGYAPPKPALFTNGDDNVDFNVLNPQNYDLSNIYNALDGDDTVVLPNTPSIANLWGFNTTLANPFMGGAGDDVIDGHLSTLDLVMQGGSDSDVVSGGWGYDTVIYNAGDGADSIDGGPGINALQLTGSTGDDSIKVIDLSIFATSIANDFRIIQTAEESYFSDHSAYTSDLSQLVLYGLSLNNFNNPYNDAAYVVTLSGGSYSITTPDVGLKLDNFIHLYDPTTGIAGPAFVDETTTPVSFYENNVLIGDSATTLLEVTNSSTHDISHFNNIQTAIITGGKGNDTLIGGAERDIFVYHAGDGADFMDGRFESLNSGPLNTLELTGSAGDDTITITNLAVLANALLAEMRAINSAEVTYQSSLSTGYATLLTDLVTAGMLSPENLINPYTHNSNWNYSVTTVNGINVSYDLQAINVGLQTSQQGTINIYDPVSQTIVQPFDTLGTTPVSFYDADNNFIANSGVSLVEVITPTGDTTSQIKNILNVVITGGTGDDTLTGGLEYNTFVYHAGDGSDHMDGGSIGFPNTLDVSGTAGDDTIRITNLSTIADAVVAKMRTFNSAEVIYQSSFSTIGYATLLTDLVAAGILSAADLINPYTDNSNWNYSVASLNGINIAYDLQAINVGLQTSQTGEINIYDPVSHTVIQPFDTLDTTPVSFYDASNHLVADSNGSLLEVNNVTSYMLNIQHVILTGGAGNDTLIGGSTDDTFVYQAGDGSDHMNGFGGDNTLQLIGSAGNDIFQIFDYTALASAIQTDLNLIMTAEEAYFSNNQAYTSDLSLLVASGFLTASSLTNPYNHAAYQVAASLTDFSVTTDGVGMQADQSGVVHRYDPVTQTIGDPFVSPFATPVLFYDQDGNDIANSITSNKFEVQTATSDTTSLFANIQHYEYVTTAGNDKVTGSAGPETYIVTHDSVGHGVTEVTNFSLANDQIDLSRVLPEEAFSTDPFGTYINFDISSGVNTVIGLDLTGGGNFDTVAILDNVLLTPADQNNYIL